MLNRIVIANLHATSHIQYRCKAFTFARKMEFLRSKRSIAQPKARTTKTDTAPKLAHKIAEPCARNAEKRCADGHYPDAYLFTRMEEKPENDRAS